MMSCKQDKNSLQTPWNSVDDVQPFMGTLEAQHVAPFTAKTVGSRGKRCTGANRDADLDALH